MCQQQKKTRDNLRSDNLLQLTPHSRRMRVRLIYIMTDKKVSLCFRRKRRRLPQNHKKLFMTSRNIFIFLRLQSLLGVTIQYQSMMTYGLCTWWHEELTPKLRRRSLITHFTSVPTTWSRRDAFTPVKLSRIVTKNCLFFFSSNQLSHKNSPTLVLNFLSFLHNLLAIDLSRITNIFLKWLEMKLLVQFTVSR